MGSKEMFKTAIADEPRVSTAKLVLVWIAILVTAVAAYQILLRF